MIGWEEFLKETTNKNPVPAVSAKNPPKPKDPPAPVQSAEPPQPKNAPLENAKSSSKISRPNVPANPSSSGLPTPAAPSPPQADTPLSWMDFISTTQGAKVEGKLHSVLNSSQLPYKFLLRIISNLPYLSYQLATSLGKTW
jgi:hypothetical protein